MSRLEVLCRQSFACVGKFVLLWVWDCMFRVFVPSYKSDNYITKNNFISNSVWRTEKELGLYIDIPTTHMGLEMTLSAVHLVEVIHVRCYA